MNDELLQPSIAESIEATSAAEEESNILTEALENPEIR